MQQQHLGGHKPLPSPVEDYGFSDAERQTYETKLFAFESPDQAN